MVRPSTSILQTKLEALQTVDFDTARIALTKGFVSLICSSLFLYYIYIRRKKRESKRERKEYSNFINYSWVKFEKAINEIYVSCICLSMYLTLIYCLITLGTYERPFPITFKGSLTHSLSPPDDWSNIKAHAIFAVNFLLKEFSQQNQQQQQHFPIIVLQLNRHAVKRKTNNFIGVGGAAIPQWINLRLHSWPLGSSPEHTIYAFFSNSHICNIVVYIMKLTKLIWVWPELIKAIL